GEFVKAVGSRSGAVIPLVDVNYWNKDWKILFPIYAVIILVTELVLFMTRVKEKADEKSHPASFSSCFSLLFKDKFVALMVLGIFLYVGAEVSMSAKLPNYLEQKFNFDIEKLGLWGTLFFFLALMAGRFLGGVILNWLSPRKFLLITSVISLVGIGGLYIAATELIGFIFISIVGLGFANVFPLIF